MPGGPSPSGEDVDLREGLPRFHVGPWVLKGWFFRLLGAFQRAVLEETGWLSICPVPGLGCRRHRSACPEPLRGLARGGDRS